MNRLFQHFHTTKGLGYTLALAFLLHVFFLNLPPKSMHLWRQSHTLAVARNFYQEEMNIFHPRVDNRFDTNGITGSHFPSFEFGLASLYHITGEHFWTQRCYCLLLHLMGIWGIYLLAKQLTSNVLYANFGAWAYAWSPLLFYYGITALPDDLALPFTIWGLYCFLAWFNAWVGENKFTIGLAVATFFFLTVAGLTKLQYLAVGFFILVHILQNRGKLELKHWIAFILLGITCSGLSIGWYLYARKQIEISGLKDFGLSFKPETEFARGLNTVLSNLSSSLPEMLLNYSSFILLLIGLYFFWKRKSQSRLFVPLLVWAGVFMAYHLIELRQMEDHDYYMMPYLPLLVIAVAFGTWKSFMQFPKWVTIILLLIQPVLAFTRIAPSRFLSEETEEKKILYIPEARQKLSECVPSDALCVVGPDDSRCIYFYLLNKKGFGFGEEGISQELLQEYIRKGAKYLYTSKKEIAEQQELAPYIGPVMCTESNFYVYSLKFPR